MIIIVILGNVHRVWGEEPVITVLINGFRLKKVSGVISILIVFVSVCAKRFVTLKRTTHCARC